MTTLSDYMSGGGGGAGGCLYGSFRPVADTGYSVIIGAGGSVGSYPNPNSGSRSSALSFLALGGGHGASSLSSGTDADSGGSGGGGAAAGEREDESRALAYGTTGQGNRGGSGNWTAMLKQRRRRWWRSRGRAKRNRKHRRCRRCRTCEQHKWIICNLCKSAAAAVL